jgi:hypothetical protein
MKRKIMLAAIAGLMMSGCSIEATDDTDSSSSSSTSTTLSLSDFEGTWVGACTYDDSDSNDLKYVINSFTITSTSIVRKTTEYASDDAACTGSATMVAQYEGSLTAGDTVDVTDSTAKALEVDLTLSVGKMQFNSSTTTDYFNSNSVCGGGWTASELRDVTTVCSGDATLGGFVSSLPMSMYTILSVEGQTLSVGDESGANDATSDANRPTSLASSTYAKSE